MIKARQSLFRLITVSLCLIIFAISNARGQQPQASPDGLWTEVPAAKFEGEKAALFAARDNRFRPTNFKLFTLSPAVMRARLAETPREAGLAMAAVARGVPEITIPMPDGSFARFRIVEAPVMAPELAAKFPEIKSYRGQGIDDPGATLRMDISPSGLHAQILSAKGTVIVDPSQGENVHVSFNKHDNRGLSPRFRCLVKSDANRAARGAAIASAAAPISGTQLRTYRLAAACTGEYAASFGGTKAGAMAAIVTTVNRVTGIYERELAVRLMLVPNNDKLIFTNAATDPFTNNNPNILIGQSQTQIDSLIGDANYDIGHTLSTGAGGLASLGVVGVSGEKAQGVTGRDDPFGDPFDVDYVAHEIGHEFGGDHTFNSEAGSCGGGNRNAATAFEPGSGSTIQAYAGICESDDLQKNSDDYFHSISLDQIISTISSGPGSHVATAPTGNHPPVVNAGSVVTIPAQTPFVLKASATDADGDHLSYCWEERDLGTSADVNDPDDGHIPLFRSAKPLPEPTRTFPRWSDILNQTQTVGEKLPKKTRTMKFRVTVRDNNSAGGGIGGADVAIHVKGDAGPFKITAPATASVPSSFVEVNWDVAKTNMAPINCEFVNIKLSQDAGATFPITLASHVPNEGKEIVALPLSATSGLRILVESVDNIFFAVSPTTFNVQPHHSTVVVVRHAEKGPGTDPDLTEPGKQRARTLARLMSAAGTSAAYATNWKRTRQTAQPTATAAGIEITGYNSESELVAPIQALEHGEHVLVVGHSDSVGNILHALGVSETVSPINDEYDNLFVVGLGGSTPTFQRLKYTADEQPVSAPMTVAENSNASEDRMRRSPTVAEQSPASMPQARHAVSVLSHPSATPDDRFADSTESRVVYLSQNWAPDESLDFYSLRQGSPIMHKELFDALEQPDSTALFRDSAYLATFGFLPQKPHAKNPDGYPIGFTGRDAIEISCAACHTSRIIYNSTEYRIDGSQAMTDIDRWQAELVRAMNSTLADGPSVADLEGLGPASKYNLDQSKKFGRFAYRVLGNISPRVSKVYAVLLSLQNDRDRRQRYCDYNDYGRSFKTETERAAATKHEPYGYGRLDALGAILNQATAEMLNDGSNAAVANAPVNYPAIWDAPQHVHVQWNGSVDNTATLGPLGRNVGQVIGVFGLVKTQGDTLVGYDSSVRFDTLERAEDLITKLWSPKWPAEFPRNAALVDHGQAIYRDNCMRCHFEMKRDDPLRQANDVLVPISRPFESYPPLMTDEWTAKNWSIRKAKVGLLAGRYVTKPLGAKFPSDENAKVASRDILTHLVFRSVLRSFVPWRDELTIDDVPQRSMMLARADTADEWMRYKARPLNGVWSTAPYLHNGSVLNIAELLERPENRKKTFRVGTNNYDPTKLGFTDGGPFLYDTSKPGNSNTGHVYGVDLPPEDKDALLEYLKTL
jgi:phosphohistidine phosphatase SixA